MLIDQFVLPTICLCFAFTGIISEAFFIMFVTWPMAETCVDQSELVNVS